MQYPLGDFADSHTQCASYHCVWRNTSLTAVSEFNSQLLTAPAKSSRQHFTDSSSSEASVLDAAAGSDLANIRTSAFRAERAFALATDSKWTAAAMAMTSAGVTPGTRVYPSPGCIQSRLSQVGARMDPPIVPVRAWGVPRFR